MTSAKCNEYLRSDQDRVAFRLLTVGFHEASVDDSTASKIAELDSYVL